MVWLGAVTVACQTSDRETRPDALSGNDWANCSHLPLSPSSIIWYQLRAVTFSG